MADGLNRVTLLGNIGIDPELKHTQAGGAVLRLRLATNESWFDKTKDARQERVEWHTVIMWGKRGEALSKILGKGSRILVEGRIQTRQWEDKEGNKRNATEIVATNVVLLGGRGEKSERSERSERSADPDTSGSDYSSTDSDFGDDEIPF